MSVAVYVESQGYDPLEPDNYPEDDSQRQEEAVAGVAAVAGPPRRGSRQNRRPSDPPPPYPRGGGRDSGDGGTLQRELSQYEGKSLAQNSKSGFADWTHVGRFN